MLENLLILAASITPFSLIVIKLLSKGTLKGSQAAHTTVITTEIPGTLIKNKIDVKTLLFDNKTFKASAKEDLDKTESLRITSEIASFCRHPKVRKFEDVIIRFFTSLGLNPHGIQERYLKIAEVPADPNQKYSTVVVQKKDTGEIFSFTKGNPTDVFEKCSRILIDGRKQDLDSSTKHKLKTTIKKLNQKGQKAIAFAYKGLPKKKQDIYTQNFTEKEMTLTGIITTKSPINREIIPELTAIQKAGIRLIVTTKIKERNAVSIAKELELINEKHFSAITPADLKQLNPKKLQKILTQPEKDYVFCELKPKHKSQIISALTEGGEVVMRTNIEKGITLEKILSSIKKAKKIASNYQMIFSHAISIKIAETFAFIIAISLGTIPPLSLLSILFLDLVMASIIELSLKEEQISELKTSKRRFSGKGILLAIISALLIPGVFFLSLIRDGWVLGEKLSPTDPIQLKATTLSFLMVAMLQILNAYILRSKGSIFRGLFKNIYLLLTTIIGVLVLYAMSIIPEILNFLKLGEISYIDWQIILFVLITLIFLHEFIKIIAKNPIPEDQSNPPKQQN